MASKGQDKTRSSSHGVKIDSQLIPKVSSDVDNELSVLGVSVYNQDEFEAGVLHQIDSEVQRRNAEQAKTFMVKEYNSVQTDLRRVRVELKNISKTIAGLLSQPLSNVVLKLRELRASQDAKRKQITTLQAREHSLLRKLSGKTDNAEPLQSSDSIEHQGGTDRLLHRDELSERLRLIQTGQITPFDMQTEIITNSSNSQIIPPHETTPTTSIEHSSHSIENHKHVTTHSTRFDNLTLDSLARPSTSETTSTWGVKIKRTSPTLQLSNDSFDGLFSEPSAKSPQKGSSKPVKSRKGKDKARNLHDSTVLSQSGDVTPSLDHSPNTGSTVSENSAQSVSSHSSLGPEYTTDSLDSLNGEDMGFEDWVPSIEDLENFDSSAESSESEYFTDDELGIEGGRRSKKKKALRPLSSDELDSDEGDHMASRKRKKGRGGKKSKKYCSMEQRKHLDDGDEQLYQMRISELGNKRSEGSPEADMVFEGGFRIPGVIWKKLYRYQQTGVKWLWELHCQQAGGVVGDEMGLGKTIEMISFLAGLKISNLRSHTTRELGLGPCLIVCPATIMHQWVSEFHTWWSPFRVAILHDTGTYSGDKRVLVDGIVQECGVLVTTYAGIRIYQDLLLRHKWDYVVLDEGHKIRNPDAEITLACKQFPTPHRIILSGSPMQNNLRELWSLFDFAFPGKLGTLPIFMEQFSVPITMGGYANATEVQVQTAYRCACVLRDTINPYLLRRMKADVKIQLPNKNEQVLFCRLTDYQHDVYGDFIKGPEVERALSGHKQVFSALMTLRKLCNHPDLVTNEYSEQVTFNQEKKRGNKERESVDHSSNVKTRTKTVNVKGLISSSSKAGEEGYGHYKRSGKMIVVQSLLKLWKEQGHRVLLFSQSKMMLDILEVFVTGQGYTYRRMDGGTQVSARQPLVKKFNEDPSIFVFLLTTRVGGLGVNLTGANRIILYDPDWNPSTDTQARERAWRIGQTRNVTIYRLLTSGTIEEKIYHRQIFKQFLTNRVLKDPRQRRFFKSNNIYDLFSLDSNATEGSTETSAIFAGTGSEVTLKKRKKEQISPEHINSPSKRKKHRRSKKKQGVDHTPGDSSSSPVPTLDDSQQDKSMSVEQGEQNGTHTSSSKNDDSTKDSTPEEGEIQESQEQCTSVLTNKGIATPSASSTSQSQINTSLSQKSKKKKKRKRKRREKVLVEGEEMEGLEHSCVYEPGSEDEESSHKQDDFILKKLFKKTGVHSALKHDVIMNSADPDYILMETEANKVAQSAARALKVSRRQCQVGTRWGRPTWTGNSGVTGAPIPGTGKPKFGNSSGSQGMKTNKLKHFNGEDAGTTLSQSSLKGSLRTSSSILLAKMRSRNAGKAQTSTNTSGEATREVQAIGIHDDKDTQLLQEVRDFIATQCKVDGQASTAEILGKFSSHLPRNDTAVFRSLLHEICDFSRHLGDGLWSLKPEFR